MEGFFSWFSNNWAAAVAMICGVGSLLYTGAYFRQDSEQKQFLNLDTMSERNAALRKEAEKNRKLKRVFQVDTDLSTPPTPLERSFLIRVIIHYQKGWRIVKTTDKEEFDSLVRDAGDFFSHPLPYAVWQEEKRFRNPKFVQFVQRAIERHGRLSGTGD